MIENQVWRRSGFALSVVWLVLCLFPLWWVLVTAFKPPTAVSGGPTYLPWIDFEPTLQAFREAFSGVRGDFLRPILSSVAISAVVTCLSVALGSMAAYALVRFEFRIKLMACAIFGFVAVSGFLLFNSLLELNVPTSMAVVLLLGLPLAVYANSHKLPGPVMKNDDITFWFVSQRMFPPVVSAFALFLLYSEMNKVGIKLLDSFPGMVLAYTAFGLPFAVWLMRDFFSTLPVEVEEAAQVDDIGRWRIFLQIVLPMSLPGLIATSLIVLSFIWNEFLFALLLTSSRWQTLPVLLAGQNSSRGDEWWAISVATLISILPMIAVAAILGRMMRSGLLSGSIK